MFKSIVQRFKTKFNAFIDRRMPTTGIHKLSHKNIFIFPTWFGFAFLSFAVLLFVLGTNYQNNLIILVSFFIVGLFTVVMLHSYSNLAGLEIRSNGTLTGFVAEPIDVSIALYNTEKRRSFVFTLKQPVSSKTVIDIVADKAKLSVTLPRRGVFTIERLQLLSEFPLGIFRTWTYLKFPITFIVYPEPKPCKVAQIQHTLIDEEGDTEPNDKRVKGDDFYELAQYQLGEPLSQVAWKQVAKGQAWQVKRYANHVKPNHNVLKLYDMPGNNIENKLSHLCFLVLEYHQAQIPFGLDLAEQIIDSNIGEQHLTTCLEALARWGSDCEARNE
ncbi:DUF58 domain-containing protein [Thalassotalea marina]|uniref:DUF58 domain-containing protein n=1 Tax=Thalassotalea marina TaxID=1673741 RepID=UPI001676EB91|nr:DUF58 domain-containing protein [Thalassotalea marina]